MIHPLVDQGLMPNLRGLMERGAMGNIATLDPCLSPMLWTSIATGKTADQHGITGFLEADPVTGGARPMASTSRKVKALWNLCHQSGMQSLVVNWFASHPAEPIRGAMVSKEFARVRTPYGAEWPVPAGSVHPQGLEKTLAELRVHPGDLRGEDLLPFLSRLGEIDQRQDPRPSKLATILAENISVHAAATHLMESEEWDFLAVYYDTLDHAGHYFMEYHPPRMEQASAEDFERYREVMNGVYCFHDMMLGRLIALAGPDAAVVVVSDHGFQSSERRPVTPASFAPETPMQWHREHGVLCMAGPGIRHDELLYGATLLDVAPTVLTLLGLPVAADMPGRPLAEALERAVAAERIASWEEVAGECGMHPPELRLDVWESSEAVAQLADLGYIDPMGDDARENVKLVRLR
jgi:predicted AlkP superfamily phosphohydrolase/phosphomutase